MSSNLKLSILDYVHIFQDEKTADSVRNTTELIQLAEQLGFTRYWFTEHHSSPHILSMAPDLLSMYAATHTKHMRIGSGGIMLPNYSPLKVAENYLLLESLYPQRIDLGLGRASGTDGITALALQRSQQGFLADDFGEQLDQLLSYFSRDFEEEHPFRNIKLPGDASLTPELFMLGSSQGGVQYAIQQGLGFVFASHLAPNLAVPVLREYREKFVPSKYRQEPKSILTSIVITAETEEKAQELAKPVEILWARMMTGITNLPLPSVEEAKKYKYTFAEEQARLHNRNRFVIGSVDRVVAKLKEMAAETQVDEIMLADFYPNQEAGIKAYSLLADAFDLKTDYLAKGE
ncbi:LLM class flavin-dependent oxidoreductase [Bacillus sp. S10C12M]|uniref:LLM class flavin-dependent oxidoreductase n=1 Tax=Bacillus sp. S10C12M TaxID=2918906 RepID=UPI00227E90BE|nr:LLM class flavin-dependent oxidoreductase [Bacillus sp. S10C12M]